MKNSELAIHSGLRENDIIYMQQLFSKIPGMHRVRLFGSRAKGNWKQGSDIDLAIEGDVTREELAMLKYAFQYESPFPFSCDIIKYSTSDQSIRDHIDRV